MATPHDREILSQVFNPLLPLSGEFVQVEDIPEEAIIDDENEENENIKQAQELETKGIQAAELGDLEGALGLFTNAISVTPTRPSAYNNRAQAYRLMGNIEQAKSDLNNAINLSNGKGRVGCQALCQRGLISLKENRMNEARSDFEAATKLGSQFAKAQLTKLNPYAALCNSMFRGVIERLHRGESECYASTINNENKAKN